MKYYLTSMLICLTLFLQGCGSSSSSDGSNSNNAPIADAGIDQSVANGDTINLSGSGSTDQDGDSLSYTWILTTSPSNSAATLTSFNTVDTSLVADVDGTYEFTLVVNDSTVDSSADKVRVVVSTSDGSNTTPIADAGEDQVASTGDTVSLSGSASSDSDGDSLSYTWTLTTPTDSSAILTSSNRVDSNFDVDLSGSYEATLIVNDGTTDSSESIITITVTDQVSNDYSDYSGSGSLTYGIAETTVANLFSEGGRVAALGTIDGLVDSVAWTIPAIVNYSDDAIAAAPDMYNDYGDQYSTSDAALAALGDDDLVEVDADGEVITAYIFADNYFEMYINGVAVAKDPVPFTNFNSNIVQFRVNKPFDITVLAADWEENLGTGTEDNQGYTAHPGDGGFVAVFKDVNGDTLAITDDSWKAQTYYTAPISDLTCLSESGSSRLSTDCTTQGTNDASVLYGLHWAIPKGWEEESYDDSEWPSASIFSNDTVGVDNKTSYTNFTDIFDDSSNDADFIWSFNLDLDNQILLRKSLSE